MWTGAGGAQSVCNTNMLIFFCPVDITEEAEEARAEHVVGAGLGWMPDTGPGLCFINLIPKALPTLPRGTGLALARLIIGGPPLRRNSGSCYLFGPQTVHVSVRMGGKS